MRRQDIGGWQAVAVIVELSWTLLVASAAAFALARLSAVAGFGGGVLLPVFTALFGLRFAVPMLTLTQLSSNGGRVWLNRHVLRWPLIGWFALGAVPLAVAGAVLLTHAPLGPLKRVLGVFLVGVVVWRRINPTHANPQTGRSSVWVPPPGSGRRCSARWDH